MTRKIVTIVGARPQFIKAAAVSREILKHPGTLEEVMVHTGQHYDPNMSQVFFDELEIPVPKYNLEVSGGTHGVMTGRMLEGIEQVLLKERPDWVLVYGDTNSTLAGALAAVKLHIPIVHVEAGLRSFNTHMPEEINRIITDRVSTLLLCPTQVAVENLSKESLVDGVHNVGDVMYDVALFYRERAVRQSQVMTLLGLEKGSFALVTCHRAENTDDPKRLSEIMSALAEVQKDLPIVLPLHPRTRKLIGEYGLNHYLADMRIVEPLAFLDMIALEQSAALIITDSGGVQKEAFFYGVPCITMRDETEWVETVDLGWNHLVGADRQAIVSAVRMSRLKPLVERKRDEPYGRGEAAQAIVSLLKA